MPNDKRGSGSVVGFLADAGALIDMSVKGWTWLAGMGGGAGAAALCLAYWQRLNAAAVFDLTMFGIAAGLLVRTGVVVKKAVDRRRQMDEEEWAAIPDPAPLGDVSRALKIGDFLTDQLVRVEAEKMDWMVAAKEQYDEAQRIREVAMIANERLNELGKAARDSVALNLQFSEEIGRAGQFFHAAFLVIANMDISLGNQDADDLKELTTDQRVMLARLFANDFHATFDAFLANEPVPDSKVFRALSETSTTTFLLPAGMRGPPTT